MSVPNRISCASGEKKNVVQGISAALYSTLFIMVLSIYSYTFYPCSSCHFDIALGHIAISILFPVIVALVDNISNACKHTHILIYTCVNISKIYIWRCVYRGYSRLYTQLKESIQHRVFLIYFLVAPRLYSLRLYGCLYSLNNDYYYTLLTGNAGHLLCFSHVSSYVRKVWQPGQ